MILTVHSATWLHVGPNQLDVATCPILAPSPTLIPAAAELWAMAAEARAELEFHDGDYAVACREAAEMFEAEARDRETDAWEAFAEAYLAQMRASVKASWPAWKELLARERVVLVDAYPVAARSPRFLLRTKILPALGATPGEEFGEEE